MYLAQASIGVTTVNAMVAEKRKSEDGFGDLRYEYLKVWSVLFSKHWMKVYGLIRVGMIRRNAV